MKKVDLKSAKKIESPLAKYNGAGQLFCVLCNVQVKNEIFWTGHVNGRAHRDSVQNLKSKKRPPSEEARESPPAKRPASSTATLHKPKSKEESSPEFKTPFPVASPVPGPSSSTATRLRLIQEEEARSHGSTSLPNGSGSNTSNGSSFTNSPRIIPESSTDTDEVSPPAENKAAPKGLGLPEGFFDDPKLDAKARGLEWRDPEEIEWENFVKEIAGEDIKSSTMRVVDEEESTKVRELEEIEEQMAHWQKVIDLERKAKEVLEKQKLRDETKMESEENDEEVDDYEEEMDWRSKRH